MKVVIPARFESSRLKGKVIMDVAGKPMVVRVAERVADVFPLDDIVIAVDHADVRDVVVAAGFRAISTSGQHRSGTERVAEVVDLCGWAKNTIVLNVQGDEPLIAPALIRSFSEFAGELQGESMGSVMTPVVCAAELHSKNTVKVVADQNKKAMLFSRSVIPFAREELMDPSAVQLSSYRRHVGLYAYTALALEKFVSSPPTEIEDIEKLEQLRALHHGIPIYLYEWFGVCHAGVDVIEDLHRVRKYF